MTAIVISGTGLFTPPQTISNDELVTAFNAWVDLFNAEHAAEIDAGTAELKDAEDVFKELGFGDARVFEAMFESTGGLSRREVRWALGKVEDAEPVGPALEVKSGARVVVRPEFCDLGGREFRRRLSQLRPSEVPTEPGTAAELQRSRNGDSSHAGAR